MLHAVGALTTVVVCAVWLSPSRTDRALGADRARRSRAALVAAVPVWPRSSPARRRPLLGQPGAAYAGAGAAVRVPRARRASNRRSFAVAAVRRLARAAGADCLARRRRRATAGLYFIAAFFAVATQAVWSASHLTEDRLGTAVVLYARLRPASRWRFRCWRAERPGARPRRGAAARCCSPAWCCCCSCRVGPIAPAALWALALLLAILNAGLFVESAAGRLPLVSQIGSVLSWLVLAVWWPRAAGSVGVLPSLAVAGRAHADDAGRPRLVGPTPPAGAATPVAGVRRRPLPRRSSATSSSCFVATNRAWSLPPWPLFGALAVITLATSAAALVEPDAPAARWRRVAAALVVAVWTPAAAPRDWGLTVVLAAAAASALRARVAAARGTARAAQRLIAGGACAALFVGEVLAHRRDGVAAAAGLPLLTIAAHVVNVCAICWR